jgi:hypothetical protein
MKVILAALVAVPLLATAAVAAERPLNESQFVRANRCVAFASLPVLKDNAVDLSAVKARIAASRSGQTAMTMMTVQSFARDAEARGAAAATPEAIDALLIRRDRYCTSFVDATQLAARAGATRQE